MVVIRSPLFPGANYLNRNSVKNQTNYSVTLTMVSSHITAKQADEILEKWASESLPVCFAVCIGNLAWHAHWVGRIRNAHGGRWVLTAGHTTNVLCTHEFEEIILTEDEDLLGIRFRHVKGLTDSGFEVNLFIAKVGGLDVESIPLVQRMLQ
jgi:hypothetical protein